jgi:hypothetical protein
MKEKMVNGARGVYIVIQAVKGLSQQVKCAKPTLSQN